MIIQLLIALVLVAIFTLVLVKILREGKKNEEKKDDQLVFKVSKDRGNIKTIK